MNVIDLCSGDEENSPNFDRRRSGRPSCPISLLTDEKPSRESKRTIITPIDLTFSDGKSLKQREESRMEEDCEIDDNLLSMECPPWSQESDYGQSSQKDDSSQARRPLEPRVATVPSAAGGVGIFAKLSAKVQSTGCELNPTESMTRSLSITESISVSSVVGKPSGTHKRSAAEQAAEQPRKRASNHPSTSSTSQSTTHQNTAAQVPPLLQPATDSQLSVEAASTTSSSSSSTATAASTASASASDVPPPQWIPRDAHAEYEVRCIVDKRERSHALLVPGLQRAGIPCETRTLAVGDFLWIARPRRLQLPGQSVAGEQQHSATYYEQQENNELLDQQSLLLDTVIVERKTIVDLAASLLDGRFVEQTRRLQCTPCRRKVIIVEGENFILPPAMQQRATSLTPESLMKAIARAYMAPPVVERSQLVCGQPPDVQDDSPTISSGIHVIRSKSLDHTVALLESMTRQIATHFERTADNQPHHLRFDVFQERFTKWAVQHDSYNLSMVFGQQLRQIQGCGPGVVTAIVHRYETLAAFMRHFLPMDRLSAQRELENLHRFEDNSNTTSSSKRIGGVLAQRILKVFFDDY